MQILRFINSKLIIQKHIYATKVGQTNIYVQYVPRVAKLACSVCIKAC